MMSRQQPARTYQPITTSLQQKKGALQELKERDDIVIKSADKGSTVVVMDKVDYLEQANRQQMKDFTKNWTLTPWKNSALK